jgi:hypothetical protein
LINNPAFVWKVFLQALGWARSEKEAGAVPEHPPRGHDQHRE